MLLQVEPASSTCMGSKTYDLAAPSTPWCTFYICMLTCRDRALGAAKRLREVQRVATGAAIVRRAQHKATGLPELPPKVPDACRVSLSSSAV